MQHCQKENEEIDDEDVAQAEYLMQNPVSLSIDGVHGITRLHLFAMHGHTSLMKYFIDKGCCVNVRTSRGETPLDMAIEYRHFLVAEILLRANAELPSVKESIESTFYTILTNVLQVPQYVCKRFCEAIRLITTLADIVALIEKAQCPIGAVVTMQDAELTKAILERHSEISLMESNYCIDVSVRLLDVPNIEALIHHGSNREQRVYRFFYWIKEVALGKTGNLDILRILIEKMPGWVIWDLNTAGCIGKIFEEAHESALTVFLQHKIHRSIQKWLDVDVLAHAFGNADRDVMKMLKKLVADEYSPKFGLGGKSGLHFAMKACIYENVLLLLNRTDVSSNTRDAMGRSPLFEVFNSAQSVVKKQDCVSRLLIFYGGDVQVFDNWQKNLLDHYRNEADWKVVQLILAHLAMHESQGHSIDQRIHQKINSTEAFANYYAICRKQLDAMKESKLCLDAHALMMWDCNLPLQLELLKFETKRLLSDRSQLSQLNLYFLIRMSLQVMNISWVNGNNKNISTLYRHGMTHLHLAAVLNNQVLTKHFIDEGFCVDVRTLEGITPLFIAIRLRHFKIVEILLRANAQISSSKQSVEYAFSSILRNTEKVPQYVCRHYYEAIKPMKSLEEIVALTEESKCTLQRVVAMQDAELTKAILERRLEINETESLHSMDVALKLLDMPNIEALMRHGENRMLRVHRFYERLKGMALGESKNLQTLNILVEKLAYWSIWDGHAVDCTRDIFEEADKDVLTIFLQHKVHLQIKNLLNTDVIAHCFGNPNPGVVNLMEKLLADGYLPGSGRDGKSGLHFAMKVCIYEHIDLLWKIVSCDLRDTMGRTALYEILNSTRDVPNKLQCAGQLLSIGADVQVFDNSGMNLLDFHRNSADWSVLRLILAHLAMLESLGASVDERIRQKINGTELFAHYYAECHRQLEDMKKTKLCLGIASYTILTMCVHNLKQSVRSEALTLLKNNMYLDQFIGYYKFRLMLTVRGIEAINRGKNILSSIIFDCCEILAPYPLIVDKIISYFSNEYVLSFY